MAQRILCIDDRRSIINANYVARTYDDGIEQLTNYGPWDILFLDHDLGCKGTGYDILCYLENHKDLLPNKVELITMNPVGRENMVRVLRKLYPDTWGKTGRP